MSDIIRIAGCPPIAALERLAQGAGAPDVATHVRLCDTCQAAVEEIHANNRFLVDAVPALEVLAAGYGRISRHDEIPGFDDLREIHRGGQGIVYRAYHRATQRHVAIKMLLHGVMATRRQRARFDREIEIAAGLDHPNIVPLYETSTPASGRPCYVMEYVDGESLDRWMHDRAAAGDTLRSAGIIRQRLEMFGKICDAITYAHERGVIHRDLKPQNILIDRTGEPRVLDFGLARDTLNDQVHTVTVTGEVLGTFAYAAPEQLRGDSDRLDTRTDVYALGVLLYELLTGEHPYPVQGSMSELIFHVTTTPPMPPRRRNPAIDVELETILLRTLAKEPDRRYAFAGALLDDLRRYLAGDVIDARRDSRRYLLRKALIRYRVAVAVTVVFVGLITAFAVAMTVKAGQLKDRLSENLIDQGRALSAAGNVPLAEDILWRELFDRVEPRADFDAALERDAHARAWYWALWEMYSRHPCRWSVATEGGRITAVAMAADGTWVAVGHASGWLTLLDAKTGCSSAGWQAHPDGIASLCIDGGGQRVATGGSDGTVGVWRASDGELLATLRADGAAVSSLLFDAGGGELRSADTAGRFRRWDLASGASSVVVHGGSGPGTVGQDGWLAVATPGGFELGRWCGRFAEFELRGTWRNQHARIAFPPSGALFAVLHGYRAELREAPSGRVLATIPGAHSAQIAFAAGSPRCATAGGDRQIRILDTTDARKPTPILRLSGHRTSLGPLAFGDEAGELLVSTEGRGIVKCWQTERVKPRRLATSVVSAHCVTYSADGRYLAIAGAREAGVIEVLDASTLACLAELDVDAYVVSSVAFDPAGRRLVAVDYDGVGRVWDWAAGETVQRLDGHRSGINSVSASRDGTIAVTAADDETIRVWDLTDGSCVQVLAGHRSRIPCVALHPDGVVAASAGKDGVVRLWDARRGQALGVLETRSAPIRTVAFSADGQMLATGNDDWGIRLWDTESRSCIATLEGHTCDVFSLAFHPEGTLLASGGRGPEVKLWDVRAPGCLTTIETGLADVFSLAFSPDGRFLAIGGDGGPAEVLDLRACDRHIAGNLEIQLDRIEAQGERLPSGPALRAWARKIAEKR